MPTPRPLLALRSLCRLRRRARSATRLGHFVPSLLALHSLCRLRRRARSATRLGHFVPSLLALLAGCVGGSGGANGLYCDGAVSAWFVPRVGGDGRDVSADLDAGRLDAPASLTLDEPGSLYLCGGAWYVDLLVRTELTITGADGLSGSTLIGPASPAIRIEEDGHRIELEQLSIQGGRSLGGEADDGEDGWSAGGGIYCSGASEVAARDVSFVDNQAVYGGALYLASCRADLEDVTFERNRAALDAELGVGGTGGAITALSTGLEIRGGRFEFNAAEATGGAIRAVNSGVALDDVRLVGNGATDGGAAALLSSDSDLVATTFDGNLGAVDGGGLLIDQGSLVRLDGAQFTDNAGLYGGAVHLRDGGVVATASSFSGNDPGDVYLEGADAAFDWGEDASFTCSADDCEGAR